jgi:hypothetical protein
MNRFVKPVSWLLIVLLFACDSEPEFVPEFPVGTVEGFRPLYASPAESEIVFTSARQLKDPGKIYVVSKYLLINEKYLGIHVFDNSNPANPIPLGFLKIVGNTDVAVRNNVLYADHLADLVALNISDWNNIKEVSRTRQEAWVQKIPPGNDRYFECVDDSRGILIGWEEATLINPKCFR